MMRDTAGWMVYTHSRFKKNVDGHKTISNTVQKEWKMVQVRGTGGTYHRRKKGTGTAEQRRYPFF